MAWAAVGAIAPTAIALGSSLFGKKKRQNAPTKNTLSSGSQILGRYDEYVDDSGIKKQLGKFSDLSNMFGQEAQKSYLDTTEGMAFSNLINQNSNKQRDILRRDSGLMGLTDEAYLSGLGRINESEGSSLASLVSGADARRSNLRSQQMAALSQVLGGEQGLQNAAQNRFSSAYGLGSQLASAGLNSETQNNQGLMNLLGQFMGSMNIGK